MSGTPTPTDASAQIDTDLLDQVRSIQSAADLAALRRLATRPVALPPIASGQVGAWLTAITEEAVEMARVVLARTRDTLHPSLPRCDETGVWVRWRLLDVVELHLDQVAKAVRDEVATAPDPWMLLLRQVSTSSLLVVVRVAVVSVAAWMDGSARARTIRRHVTMAAVVVGAGRIAWEAVTAWLNDRSRRRERQAWRKHLRQVERAQAEVRAAIAVEHEAWVYDVTMGRCTGGSILGRVASTGVPAVG